MDLKNFHYPLPRKTIVHALKQTLESLDFVNALWEGGAVAFDRADEWSDIDLVIDAKDDRCADVWPAVDAAIRSLGEVDLMFEIPAAPLGLHSQRFYRIREAGPYLMIDIGVFPESTKDKLLDPETHGKAIVHFDRSGVTNDVKPSDKAAEIRKRLAILRITVPLFQALVAKEINRRNEIEAVAFYHGWAVRPLVELLRIKHCPQRYQFHTRYVQYDLPKVVADRLTPFFYVRDLADLAERRAQAEAWALKLLEELADTGNKQT